jgi:predicted CXXCH cytochrome family protein
MIQIHSILLTCGMVALATVAAAQTSGETGLRYIGSESCVGCHEGATRAWEESHHASAWILSDERSVLGNFDGAVHEHKGVITQFFRRDGAFFVSTEAAGKMSMVYEVKGVAGIAPLQQYLLETEPGRLQSFDVVWDVEREEWYHLYPDQDLPPGDGLHWTGPYKSWNARCAECHATGFEKNYSLLTRTYASGQAEIGVGCEACHGPGEAHLEWAKAPDAYDAATDAAKAITAKALTVDLSAASPEPQIQLCAGCHSRREPFGDGNPVPGTPFHDSYRLSLLRNGLYHADGSILDEVYVYGSFLQSKMYGKGVRCTDCHEPHGAQLKAKGNAVCTQCHSPAGDPRFPTLQKATYDDPAHYFHEPGTAGAACVGCHMIERVYMVIDGRRDHSFRVPRPDLSAETGAPNACTDCHADREPAWASAEIERRFPDSARRGPHFSQAFAAAWREPGSVQGSLIDIAEDTSLPAIIRASALELLTVTPSEGIAARTAPLLEDEDPLVRGAAVAAQRGALAMSRVQNLVPLLDDPIQAVRIATAREMLDLPIARLPPRTATAMRKAMEEWQASSFAKADFPETHLAMGGAALVMRNPQAAEAAFREVVRLDPQRVEAWTMIIRILAALGDKAGALRASEDAIAANPKNETLLLLKRQLDEAG